MLIDQFIGMYGRFIDQCLGLGTCVIQKYAYLSSSSVKEIASFNGDISQCVPDFVGKLVYEKYGYTRQE